MTLDRDSKIALQEIAKDCFVHYVHDVPDETLINMLTNGYGGLDLSGWVRALEFEDEVQEILKVLR